MIDQIVSWTANLIEIVSVIFTFQLFCVLERELVKGLLLGDALATGEKLLVPSSD